MHQTSSQAEKNFGKCAPCRLPILAVLMIVLVTVWPGGSADAGQAPVWVDPSVASAVADGGTAPVLVVLRESADLSQLGLPGRSWAARGETVFSTLMTAHTRSQSGIRAFLDRAGIPYRSYWIVNGLSLTLDADLLSRLTARDDVARIVSNAPIPVGLAPPAAAGPLPQTAGDRGIEPNLAQINAPALWALGQTGSGMTIGIADTGVQWDHPALLAQYAGWNGSTADHAYHWWDAVHHDGIGGGTNPCGINLTVPCDDYGHGTHVAGIAVGDDGADNRIGVAPGADWIACRNMDSGYGTPATYIECYQFFLAPTDLNGNHPDPSKRPHIVNSSFACLVSEGCTAFNELHDAVNALRAAGVFMAVSAGNGGPGCGTVNTPPALEAGAFSVGAVDALDVVTAFSSRGPVTVDGSSRMKPDLMAPGYQIRSSLYLVGSDLYTYSAKSGTSMAAPHVAGGVALLWSAYPDLVREIAVTEWLLSISAAPQDCGAACCAPSVPGDWPNTVYGYGRMDLWRAYGYYQNRLILPLIMQSSAP
jgi:subtilisin family serine protease